MKTTFKGETMKSVLKFFALKMGLFILVGWAIRKSLENQYGTSDPSALGRMIHEGKI